MTSITIDAAVEALQTSVKFTIRRIDDWKNVIPEGRALRNECETYQAIIVGVLDKPHLPIHGILKDVNSTLTETNKLITTFIEQDTRKDRTMLSKTKWLFQRMYLASMHRRTFKSTTKELEESKIKIHDTLALSAVVNKPTVHWYYGDMDTESFKFWKEISGEELYASSFGIFIETYQHRHGHDWDSNMLERIRRVACRHGDHLTVAGFITLTKMCGFPLDCSKLPTLEDSHVSITSSARMEVAALINGLISDYSTKEMRDWLVSIFTWYKGFDKQDTEAWQKRANEWAYIIKANRSKDPERLEEHEKLAETVDMARRSYSFFFQRYMVVFKIGQLSKEMFKEVDFPGKARMFEFIEHVGPLDHANYHIVMDGKPHEWENKKPKVYKFLDDYIKSEQKAKAIKEAAEAAAVTAAKVTAESSNEINMSMPISQPTGVQNTHGLHLHSDDAAINDLAVGAINYIKSSTEPLIRSSD